jgi:hypothetical protein
MYAEEIIWPAWLLVAAVWFRLGHRYGQAIAQWITHKEDE